MSEHAINPAGALREGQLARLTGCLRSHWVRCFLLVTIGFLVRMPALQGTPLWDDDCLIDDNPFIKSPLLFPEAFRHYLFPDGFSSHYRPVQNISFGLDYLTWNSAPYDYHLTNVMLHLLSGVLLYFLLRKLLAQFSTFSAQPSNNIPQSTASVDLAAFFIALLWIVHPVHSAAIDYISGRADSLAFLFASSGWLLYLRALGRVTRASRLAYYAAAVLSGMLALCSREIAGIWLCIFLLHLLFFSTSINRKAKLAALAACFVLFGAYVAVRHLPERPIAVETSRTAIPVRAALMLRALGDYGRLMVCPTTLYMERTVLDPDNYASNRSWKNSVGKEYLSILGALVLGALAYGACRRGIGQPVRLFGALWFMLGYLPISNLIDLNANVAEHWLYLPSVGFLIFVAGVVLEFPFRVRRISTAFACLAVCGLSARAYARSTDWVTPKTFYQRTASAGGASTRVAVNLAIIYANSGELAKAEAIFRRVLSITPDYPIARNGLADVLYRQGKRSEGEAIFVASKVAATESRKEYPRTWIAALNLARIRHNEKDDVAAIALLEQARKDYPHIWQIIRFESEVLRLTRGPNAALRLVAEFARDNWWHHGASISLGRLLAEKGDVEGAVEALNFASWLDLHDAEALNLVASIRMRQNRLEEARTTQERAVSRQPNEPRQYRLLSEILLKMGRNSEAQTAVAKIASLEAVAKLQVAAN